MTDILHLLGQVLIAGLSLFVVMLLFVFISELLMEARR